MGGVTRKNNLGVRRRTNKRSRSNRSRGLSFVGKRGFGGERLTGRLSRRLRGGFGTPPVRRVNSLNESLEEKIERQRREREANNIADAEKIHKKNEDERIKAQTYEINQEENRAIKKRERTEIANKKATERAGLKPETGIGESGFIESYKENLEGNKLHEIQNRLDSLIAGFEANSQKNSADAKEFKRNLNELTQQTDTLSQTMKTQTNRPWTKTH